MINEALKLHEIGLKVIPTGANKRPTVKWKQYQAEQTKEAVKAIFKGHKESMALITGIPKEILGTKTPSITSI